MNNSLQKKPMVFIFPYKGVGGVSLLFLRLAEHIANLEERDVFVVDYADGYIAKHLTCSLVKLIEYSDSDPVDLPDHAVLVFQSMTPWSLFKSLNFNLSNKFLFWNCHPYNLVPVLPVLRPLLLKNTFFLDAINCTLLFSFKNRLKQFLSLLIDKNAIVFMDEANVNSTFSRLGYFSEKIDYLPIPIPIASLNEDCCVEGENAIRQRFLRITWIGRIVDFKYTILLRAIERLSKVQEKLNVPLQVTIIGDGEYKKNLVDKATSFHNIKIIFIDYMSSDQLDSFLKNDTDMLMAMGTSALEGAKLKVPTLLLDFSYSVVEANYNFKWLQHQSGFNLGSPINSSHFLSNDNSMLCRVKELLEQQIQLGEDAYVYVNRNHSIDFVARKLLQYAESSNCYYQDLVDNGSLGRGFLYSFFSKVRGLVN